MNTSTKLFKQAKTLFPGGVNSPVRAYNYVGGTPPFFTKGDGAYVYDVDSKRYIDYVGAYGPMIVGHSNPSVIAAVTSTLQHGFHFGAPHELEIKLAEKIMQHMPIVEKIRFVSSGTEACMSAIRLARGYTKKRKIIKFNGCYHGHSDSLLVKSGSGTLSCGEPSSPGVLTEQSAHTLVAHYNDIDSVTALCQAYSNDIAAIIVEPVAGNMGFILPQNDFLHKLRQLCDQYQALLLFDEVMTGFRVATNGCSGIFNISPDLTMLGKVIGGGFPLGAFGGRADIMSNLAPEGSIYQAGTLSGSPVALAAGLANLEIVTQPGFYEKLSQHSSRLTKGLVDIMTQHNIGFQSNFLGGMFGFYFSDHNINSMPVFSSKQRQLFIKFFHSMLVQGINMAPSPYEAAFISSMHTVADIDATLSAAAISAKQLSFLTTC